MRAAGKATMGKTPNKSTTQRVAKPRDNPRVSLTGDNLFARFTSFRLRKRDFCRRYRSVNRFRTLN